MRSLKTADTTEARRRAPHVVAEIKREIETRRRRPDGSLATKRAPETTAEQRAAAWWAERRQPDPSRPGRFVIPESLSHEFDEEVERLRGDPVGPELDHRGDPTGAPEYDPKRDRAALAFVAEVTGEAVPVAAELDRYFGQQGITGSYRLRTRSAVSLLANWLADDPEGDRLQAVTSRRADLFGDFLANGSRTTATVNSLLSALSAYWTWMHRRGLVEGNPWTHQQRRRTQSSLNATKRPFTDEEITALLSGGTTQTLHDLMRIAALSGLRLTEIGGLTVADTAGGYLEVRASKTTAGKRVVPIHPDLEALIKRRSKGKAGGEFLIEELTAPPSRGGRRGSKASSWFTKYRRDLGLDDRLTGRRQSNAEFHSFRRWWVTKLEQAGVAPHIIAALAGHEEGRAFLALRVYSAGPSGTQLEEAIKLVRLPTGVPADPPAIRR